MKELIIINCQVGIAWADYIIIKPCFDERWKRTVYEGIKPTVHAKSTQI